MDPLTVKPHEAATWTATVGALFAFLMRIFTVRQMRRGEGGKSKREQELEKENAELAEKNRQQLLELTVQPIRQQLADVLRENGRQAERLDILEADWDALGNKLRSIERRLPKEDE